jgi:hypothetical protein
MSAGRDSWKRTSLKRYSIKYPRLPLRLPGRLRARRGSGGLQGCDACNAHRGDVRLRRGAERTCTAIPLVLVDALLRPRKPVALLEAPELLLQKPPSHQNFSHNHQHRLPTPNASPRPHRRRSPQAPSSPGTTRARPSLGLSPGMLARKPNPVEMFLSSGVPTRLW